LEVAKPVVPRMWRVTDPQKEPGTTFFLLGITHIGLPFEYDTYLDRSIVPALNNSQDIYLENSNLPIEQQPACDQPLSGQEAERVLTEARQYVQRSMERFRHWQQDEGITPKVPDAGIATYARVYAELLTEFGLYDALQFFGPMYTDTSKLAADTLLARGPVLAYLHTKVPDLPTHSIDQPRDPAEAFCASKPEDRLALLRQELHLYTGPRTVAADSAEARRNLQQANDKFVSIFKAGRQENITLEPIICLRNIRWVKLLQNVADGKNHFVAVGVGHLFPVLRDSKTQCNGLLQDFKNAGYEVTPVQ